MSDLPNQQAARRAARAASLDRAKAAIEDASTSGLGVEVERDGCQIEVEVSEVRVDGAVVEARCIGRCDGKVVLDDTVRVVNPPTLVPDPAGDVVRTFEVPAPTADDPDAVEVREERYRDDPAEALRIVLADVVERLR